MNDMANRRVEGARNGTAKKGKMKILKIWKDYKK